MKKILLCIVIFSTLMCFCSCGYEYDGESLLGTWREKGVGEADYSVYDFYSDEKVKVTYYNYGVAYAISDCYYTVENGNRILIVGDSGYYDIYEFKISGNGNKLTIKSGSTKLKLKKYESEYNKDERIFGTWRDVETSETYFFGESYLGMAYNTKMQGREFGYSTKNGILFFPYTSSLIVPIEYRIDGNKLYFESNGEIIATLERVEE